MDLRADTLYSLWTGVQMAFQGHQSCVYSFIKLYLFILNNLCVWDTKRLTCPTTVSSDSKGSAPVSLRILPLSWTSFSQVSYFSDLKHPSKLTQMSPHPRSLPWSEVFSPSIFTFVFPLMFLFIFSLEWQLHKQPICSLIKFIVGRSCSYTPCTSYTHFSLKCPYSVPTFGNHLPIFYWYTCLISLIL